MTSDATLRSTLAAWFKDATTNDGMPNLGAAYGLVIVPDGGQSKRDRAAQSLAPLSRRELAELARNIGRGQGNFALEDLGLFVLEESQPALSEITRRDVAKCFGFDLSNERDVVTMLRPLFSLAGTKDFSFLNPRTLADEIHKHMTLNPEDWSVEFLFSQIGAYDCPTDRFGRLLEATLHPLARRGPAQSELAAELNAVLVQDGYALEPLEEESGHPIYRFVQASKGVKGPAKNLIFASTGPKPEIGFSDAVNNDIVILHNESSCLVYDRKIGRGGLGWADLVDWWGERTSESDTQVAAKVLGERLQKSLASDGERNLFSTYFRQYRQALGS
jgi:hypothetical protein